MDDATPKLLYKIPQAAQRLSCSVRKIYGLADSGELELVKAGFSSFITAASIEAYVARLREKARTKRRPAEHVTA